MGVIARRRKSGITYYVSFMVGGEQVFERSGTDKREAERLYRRRKREVADGSYRKKPKKRSVRRFAVSHFVKEFIAYRRARRPPVRTIDEEEGRLQKHVVPLWGDRSVLSLDDDDIRDFLRAVRSAKNPITGKTLSENTVLNVFSTLSLMLDEAERQARKAGETRWSNPCKQLRPMERPQHVRRPRDYYRREEVEALITDPRIPFDRRVFWAWLFFTGMRHDEAAGIRVGAIEWDETPLPRFVLRRQASGKPLKEDRRGIGLTRIIPLHPALGALTQRWLAEGFEEMYCRPPTPEDYLLPSTADVAKPRPVRTSLKQIRRVSTMLGFPERTIHETRNTFLTLACEDAPELESIIERITHQAPGRASETYKRSFWLAKCEAVKRLRLGEGLLTYARGAPEAPVMPKSHDVSHDVEGTEAKKPRISGLFGGADGTRTRGLRRDRPAL